MAKHKQRQFARDSKQDPLHHEPCILLPSLHALHKSALNESTLLTQATCISPVSSSRIVHVENHWWYFTSVSWSTVLCLYTLPLLGSSDSHQGVSSYDTTVNRIDNTQQWRTCGTRTWRHEHDSMQYDLGYVNVHVLHCKLSVFCDGLSNLRRKVGVDKVSKNFGASSKLLAPERWHKPVPYRVTTNIRCHRTKVSHAGYVHPCITKPRL
jgi:hypothetical protein